MCLLILTDCLTTSAHSGGTPYSGFSWRNRHKSLRGGANAPPICAQRKHIGIKPLRRTHVIVQLEELRERAESNLASVSPVDDLDPLLARQTVDVNLVGISTAMPLLLGPSVLKLYLIHALQAHSGHD